MKKFLFVVSIILGICFVFFRYESVHGFPKGGGSRAVDATPSLLTQPTGALLWQYLETNDYTKKFKMWPGKSSFYQGKEPHGALLTTYVNIPALMSIAGKKGSLSEGSMIVKENYSSEKQLKSITVMYKVYGYNPEAGDWFWAQYAPGGKVEAEGKVDTCIKCHAENKNNDYIFTAPLK